MSESIRGSRGFGFPRGHLLIFLKLDNNNKVIIVKNNVERHTCATQIIPNAKVPPEANVPRWGFSWAATAGRIFIKPYNNNKNTFRRWRKTCLLSAKYNARETKDLLSCREEVNSFKLVFQVTVVLKSPTNAYQIEFGISSYKEPHDHIVPKNGPLVDHF